VLSRNNPIQQYVESVLVMSTLFLTDGASSKLLNTWARNPDSHSMNSSISVKVEVEISPSPTPYFSEWMCGGSGLYLQPCVGSGCKMLNAVSMFLKERTCKLVARSLPYFRVLSSPNVVSSCLPLWFIVNWAC
jgi:hypothetical protein